MPFLLMRQDTKLDNCAISQERPKTERGPLKEKTKWCHIPNKEAMTKKSWNLYNRQLFSSLDEASLYQG